MDANELLAQLVAQTQQQQQFNQQLVALVTQLQSQQPATPQTRENRIKVATPDRFDGKRANLRGFLAQVQLNFEANPSAFTNDRRKTTFVGSYLGGTALEWFTPLLENESELLDDYDLFVGRLKAMFGDADEARRAEASIKKLAQKGSAADYAAKFQLLAVKTGWDDKALMSQFRSGLRDDVLDHLLNRDKPDNLNELIQQAIDSDDLLFRRRQEKQERAASRPSVWPNRPLSTLARPQPNNGPVPMDLSSTAFKKGPLSPEERQRRFSADLCLYCGKPGHKIRECKARTDNQHRLSATTAQNPHDNPSDSFSPSGNGRTLPISRE